MLLFHQADHLLPPPDLRLLLPVPQPRALEVYLHCPWTTGLPQLRPGLGLCPEYLDVRVLHPGWCESCGRVGVTLEVEDCKGLLAGAPSSGQGQALKHSEAQCGIHMDSTSPRDPTRSQPVGQAWGSLHVTYFIGPNAVLLLIQATQFLPLRAEEGKPGGC